MKTISVGTLLNNRYRLQTLLGEGGAGIIFKAEDEQLSREVAIKLLLSEGDISGDKLARFRGEARSVARLNHPNIITLYDYAEENGRPYLVIEYIPGMDLWELDNGYAPNLMPLAEALPIFDGILAALEYSHAHQVIHRDLKPENVMITPDKQVKVMDFGLARIEGQSRLTQDGLVAGTAAYLAPELARGEPGDHRVDLYAMGIIMYELTTGRRPFSGDDPLTVVSQHIHAPVVPPQHYNSAIPNDLQAVILKLLAKSPHERYATAGEARRALAPIIERLTTPDAAAGEAEVPSLTDDPANVQALLERIARGKMVGREEELQKLKEHWDLVRLGELETEPLVIISGEGGIGKTRLLRELQVYSGLRDGYIIYGRAHEQDAGTPYALFARVLRNYIAEQPADVLQNQMSGFMAGEVVKLVPQVAEKMGYIQPNPSLEPSAERTRLLDQISRFILNIAQDQPALLLLDDLHFADPGSLDILNTLMARSPGNSLMIAAAYRDVALSYSHPVNRFINSLRSAGLVRQFPLRRLPQGATKQLLESLLANKVSRKFLRSIYEATEGNPLFVEELIKSLVVDGQLQWLEGRWEQRSDTLPHIPGSIKAVLGRRLERISEPTLELLRLSAVIGRSFGLDLLLEASAYDDDKIQWAIEEALSAQLIEVVRIIDQPPEQIDTGIVVYYQFQHALIRETLYEELRPLRRRRLHRRVGAALERMAADHAYRNPAILARHFIAGAEDEKAVAYLRQAGKKAIEVHANQEAVDYLSQAYEILEDLSPELTGDAQQANLAQRFELLTQQRDVCNMMGDRDREFKVLQMMLDLADQLDDRLRRLKTMSQMSTYYWHVGNLAQAEQTAREALQMARTANDEGGQQAALERVARVLWTQRDPRSMEYATQALVLAQKLRDRPREGRLTELVGHIFIDTLYEPERAAFYFEQALKICEETHNPYEAAWTLWGMGKQAMLISNYPAALERFTEAKKTAESIGATLQVGWDLYHSGNAWYNLGDYDRSLELYRQAQTIFETSQHPRGKIYVINSIGMVMIGLGQMEEAAAQLETAAQQAEARQDLRLMLRSYEALAYYYRLLGGEANLTNAIRFSNRIIKLATDARYMEHQLIGFYLRGTGFFQMRKLSEAVNSSIKAVSHMERLNYLEAPHITKAAIFYTHSQIMSAMGQLDTARNYMQKAYNDVIYAAGFISDEQLRYSFLQNVSINRVIIAAGQNLSTGWE
ncbi:MAG: protein kinase [Anaerolineaceae bacterium]|nr:protein kinase [Anaerolineaceae bacterium]MCB9101193.1 protein kinase [Anaerolineales bacterium]